MKGHAAPTHTLEAILAEREKVLADIRQQKAFMKQKTQALFAPPKATSKMEAMINSFDKAVAIYDGVVVGMRIVGRFKSFFRRRH